MQRRDNQSAQSKVTGHRERLVFAIIMCSGFLTTLGVGLFSFTLPLLSLDEKVSGAWLSTGFAGYFLAKLVASPVSGVLADRVGPFKVLLVAALVGALIPFVWIIQPVLGSLYLMQFTLGLVSGLFKPVGLAVLGGIGPQNRLSFWYSWHTLAFNVAVMIGPLFGGWLYLGRSMEPIMYGVIVCMGLAALLIAGVLPRDIGTQRDSFSTSATGQNSGLERVSLYIAIAGRSLGIGLVIAFYPIVLSMVLGQSGLVVGAVFGVPSLVICLGLPLFGYLLGGKSKSMATVVGMLISAGALFALGACRDIWQFVVFGGLMGVGSALSIPSSMTLASELSRKQGEAFGLAHCAAGVGFVAGPLLGGLVVHNYHGVGHALQMAAVIGACACMPLLFFAIREQFSWSRVTAMIATGICLLFLSLFGVLQLTPQSVESDGLYRYSDVAMGTVVKLTLKADSRTAADAARKRVLAAMRLWQHDFDHRDPDGSIGRINRGAGKQWVKVSDRAFGLLERTLAFSEQTGGVFDPTIGALTDSPLYYVLDESMAQERKQFVDYSKVKLDKSGKRVRLEKLGMALDMGGIAKGAIIDMAVRLLRKQGIASGVVEAGGDLYCFGDREWTVGIRHPRTKAVYMTLTVREKGVCGSGDYEQFVTMEKDDESIFQHHIINPSDMASADKSIGVTVVADSAEQADGLATAVFIMGPDAGKPFVQTYFPNVAVMCSHLIFRL